MSFKLMHALNVYFFDTGNKVNRMAALYDGPHNAYHYVTIYFSKTILSSSLLYETDLLCKPIPKITIISLFHIDFLRVHKY